MEKNLLPIGVANLRPNFDTFNYGSKDTRFVNCFFEILEDSQTDSQKVFCVKRPGIAPGVSATYGMDGIGLGCFAAQPYTSTNIYFGKQGFGGLTYIQHFNGSTVTHVQLIPSILTKRLNFTNIGLPDDTYNAAVTASSNLYLLKGSNAGVTVTPVVGATLTRAIYLNNRVFVGDTVTSQVFQSALGDYTTYSASEYITVESYGGKLVELGRYNNFIVAFKEYSTEFFEDVANDNGSVLGRVGQALQQLGCVHPNTIVDTGSGELIWLATDEAGNRSVVKLNNSFNVEPIQNDSLAKYLNLVANYDGSYAYLLNSNGHQFYVLTLKQAYTDKDNTLDVSNITFVYDLKTKLWTNWSSYGEGGTFAVGSVTYTTLGRWNVAAAARNSNNTTYVQDFDTGNIYQLDDYYGSDLTSPIVFSITIGNIDLGTFKRKFLNKLTIYADGYHNTDYYTTASDPKDAQLFTVTLTRGDSSGATTTRTCGTYPFSIRALGSAKRFTLNIGHYYAIPLRISAINLDYDIGEGYAIS